MFHRVRLSCLFSVLFLSNCCGISPAQHPANSNATYQQLRGLQPGDEVITVNNLVLHRDAATFTFTRGDFAFYGKVNGKVTGAVFKGEGHLHITPPTVQERHNLSIATHTEEFDEDFDQVVLRFTDGTAAELHEASTGNGEQDSFYAKAADEARSFLRHHSSGEYVALLEHLHYRKIDGNLDLRLLEDVLSPAPGGYFYAALHGKKSGRVFFILDPQGVAGLTPEEVSLQNWNASYETMLYPLAFHRAAEYASGTASGSEHNASYHVVSENLDVSIEKNGFLSSLATVIIRADQDGVTVVPLDLYPSLRVSKVETDKGEALDFVQEDANEDPDFGVVLAAPLKKGETATLKITYGGKDVVFNEGQGNYFPIARNDWFPNSIGFSDFASYRMLFHVPKGLQLLATGTKMSESTDGGITTSEWKTEQPLTVVGFTLGDFKSKEARFDIPPGGNLTVDAFANIYPPDYLERFSHSGLGTMDTTPMLVNILSQGEAAAQVYTNYFGPLTFTNIALTQQSVCSFGQSWPMLVYLPICGFLDGTQRHELITWQFQRPDEVALFNMYMTRVVPHEVAHQWWGHTVGASSYRDEWMREGFADESAAIYLQATGQMDQFFEFWKLQRKLITEKNAFGFRPIDVGPVTMGRRLGSPQAGWNVYQHLVYPKGAYILHMIQMMMWTQKDGDARFKATMHDFVESHRLQAATTEDFKSTVEKHMSPQMDLEGNHRMDWFFNQYVYGTDLPAYHFEAQTTPNGDGTSLHIKLIQSGVPDSFRMPVPMYVELADGKVQRLGSINITGNKTIDQTVQLPKFSSPVKRVVINYYYDVLSTDN